MLTYGCKVTNETLYNTKDILDLVSLLLIDVHKLATADGCLSERLLADKLEVVTLTPAIFRKLVGGRPFSLTLMEKQPIFVKYSVKAPFRLGLWLVPPEEMFESDLERMLGLVNGVLPRNTLEQLALKLISEHPVFPVEYERSLLSLAGKKWAESKKLHADWRGPSRVSKQEVNELLRARVLPFIVNTDIRFKSEDTR